MVDLEASGSCHLAGSWWIGSSSSGRRTTEKLAGPASRRAVGESGVHSSQSSSPAAPQLVSGNDTRELGGDGTMVDDPRNLS